MKFLVDAQLPRGLCVGLAGRGYDAVYVSDALGAQTGDEVIVNFAIAHDRILISKDGELAAQPIPAGLRVVWLRLGNATNRRLVEWLEQRWEEIEIALNAGDKFVEVR